MPIRGVKYVSTVVFHPGSTLSEKLEELDISPQDFAKQIGFEENIVVDIVEERGIITPELAEAFEKVLKIPAAFWIRKQKRYSEFIDKKQAIRGVKYIPQTISHPGDTLAEKLQELDMSSKDFAEQIGVNEDVIIDIVMEKEEGRITPELAEAFDKALNIPTHFWMRGQELYDELILNKKLVKS